jgi:hypothetical protein
MVQTTRPVRMLILVTLLLASVPKATLAQDGEASTGLNYASVDPMAREMESAERKIRRGRIGLIVSPLLLAGGTVLLAIGLSDNVTFGEPIPQLYVPGAVATAAGFVGTIVSGVAFSDGKTAKRRIEAQRLRVSVGLGTAELLVRF